MVSMPSNMFLTVTLPATLWFFDKQKVNSERKDKILFIDARNTYHQRDRAHREWKEEHIQNLTAIVRLYRGENERYLELIGRYINQANVAMDKVPTAYNDYFTILKTTITNLQHYSRDSKTKHKPEVYKKIVESGIIDKMTSLSLPHISLPVIARNEAISSNEQQLAYAKNLEAYTAQVKEIETALKASKDALLEVLALADKEIKVKNDKDWIALGLNGIKLIEELQQQWKDSTDEVTYFQTNMNWLQSRFPEAKYADVAGLCKVAERTEYVEEQDYSMNAGRYVGLELDGNTISNKEFIEIINSKCDELNVLNKRSNELIHFITQNSKEFI
jgi:type I restriction enzyme M protein